MYRILLVDDEPNILNALRRLLSRLKPEDLNGEYFVIDTYSSPEDALARADEVRIDLAISDYRMPGMNGVEFLKSLIAKQPDVARLVLSGYADLDGVIAAINEAKVFRFISKPWNDAELLSAVAQALNARALAMENERLARLAKQQQVQIAVQEAELRRLVAASAMA